MKRFIRIFFLFILGCIIAAFSVANRQPVRFIVDPFIDRDAAASIEIRLFLLLFIALFIGLIAGALTVWFGQAHWRRTARRQRKEATLWKREAENLKRGLEISSPGTATASAPRPLRSYL